MARFNNILSSGFLKNFQQILGSGKKKEGISRSKSFWIKIRTWVMLALGISLFTILINQISLNDFFNVFSNVNLGYFLIAIFIAVSATVFKTIRFEYFFHAPGRWLSLYGTFAFLRVVYYVLPFNSGELVYLSVLKKSRFSPTIAETTPSWVFLRATDVIAIAILFIVAINLGNLSGDLFGLMYSFRWMITGISIILVLIFLSLPFWIPKISTKPSENWFLQRIHLFKIGITRTFGIQPFIRTLLTSILIWCILIGSEVFAQLAFNTPLSIAQCFLVSLTISCISLLPVNTPLSLGTGEAIWSGVLVLAGLNASLAISIAISIRVILMLIIFIDGIIGLSILLSHQNDNREK